MNLGAGVVAGIVGVAVGAFATDFALAVVGTVLGSSLVMPAYWLCGLLGVALAIVDVRTRRLPYAMTGVMFASCAVAFGLSAVARGDASPLIRAVPHARVRQSGTRSYLPTGGLQQGTGDHARSRRGVSPGTRPGLPSGGPAGRRHQLRRPVHLRPGSLDPQPEPVPGDLKLLGLLDLPGTAGRHPLRRRRRQARVRGHTQRLGPAHRPHPRRHP